MVKSIGLIDWDIIGTKQHLYFAPNYDLGITYAYLKKDKNISVKLVSNIYENKY